MRLILSRVILEFMDRRVSHGSIAVSGTFKNYNTIEEFKAADKTALFNQEAERVRV